MKKGFTLAEVLITLGIIGVVAALTMPSLIAKQQEKQTITALKKSYSAINQAYALAKNEYGEPSTWPSTDASINMGDNITKFMKVTKTCHEKEGCFPKGIYKKLDGIGSGSPGYDQNSGISKYILSDGTLILFYSYGGVPRSQGKGVYEKAYGAMLIDTNGFKGPNTNGIDSFSFIVTKDTIAPSGAQDMLDSQGFPNQCNRNDCKAACEACAAWVIYNENMDYLKCDDLSWDNKTKCK